MMLGIPDTTDGREQVSDETILNVLRRSDVESLPTPKIADDETVPIGQAGVRKRLKQLREEGRVESATEGQTLFWNLDDAEPTEPVYDEQIAHGIRVGKKADQAAGLYYKAARALVETTGFVLLVYLVIGAEDIVLPVITPTQLLVGAAVIGFVGVAFFAVSGIAQVASYAVPRVVKWYVENPKAA